MRTANRTQINVSEDATKRILRIHAALRKEAQDCKPDDAVSVVIAAAMAILEQIIAIRARGFTEVYAEDPESGDRLSIGLDYLLKEPEPKEQDRDNQDHA